MCLCIQSRFHSYVSLQISVRLVMHEKYVPYISVNSNYPKLIKLSMKYGFFFAESIIIGVRICPIRLRLAFYLSWPFTRQWVWLYHVKKCHKKLVGKTVGRISRDSSLCDSACSGRNATVYIGYKRGQKPSPATSSHHLRTRRSAGFINQQV